MHMRTHQKIHPGWTISKAPRDRILAATAGLAVATADAIRQLADVPPSYKAKGGEGRMLLHGGALGASGRGWGIVCRVTLR